MTHRPHVVIVVPRGEAIRNFVYSDTIPTLAKEARITLLSLVTDEHILEKARPFVEEIVALDEFPQARSAYYLRTLTENAHDRRLWSEVAKNNWKLRDRRAAEQGKMLQRRLIKGTARALGNRLSLRALTRLEQFLSFHLRRTRTFDDLFSRLQPDLVFNASHVHGMAGELPTRVAHAKGIATAGFIFSWDNLTSRSRIFVPYDHYLVWHEGMKEQLLGLYPHLHSDRVIATGTPQFDFHFQKDKLLSRSELGRLIGIDPNRPYVLYTAGIAHHFPEEHRHVQLVIDLLANYPPHRRPLLVVRTNIKDTSPEMKELAETPSNDVVFAAARWSMAAIDPTREAAITPLRDDIALYSSLLRHCSMGINAASTVTLELLLFDKPTINLDFDPPGSDLPWERGYERHIRFDHYRPVAESGAVMVARSEKDMGKMLETGLNQPEAQKAARQTLLGGMFGAHLDGRSGQRVGETLTQLARP